jgi:hypothetical protein
MMSTSTGLNEQKAPSNRRADFLPLAAPRTNLDSTDDILKRKTRRAVNSARGTDKLAALTVMEGHYGARAKTPITRKSHRSKLRHRSSGAYFSHRRWCRHALATGTNRVAPSRPERTASVYRFSSCQPGRSAKRVSSCVVAVAVMDQRMRQCHAAEVAPLVETAAVPFRAFLSRACGQP